MTKDEWCREVEAMVAHWPHYDWRQATSLGSLDVWYADMAGLDAEAVGTGWRALARTGREWPPNGAQIRNSVLELQSDTPGFGEVWQRLMQAASRFGWRRETEALAWLAEWSPLAARLAELLPFRELALTTELEVFHGQARRSWDQLCARSVRDAQVAGLPPAGLKAVERANGPHQIGDVLAEQLPAPAERRGRLERHAPPLRAGP